eukprot:9182756-Pyramimonas_sp.AAC.1
MLPSGHLGATRGSCVRSSSSRPGAVQNPWRDRVGVASSWGRLDVTVRGLRRPQALLEPLRGHEGALEPHARERGARALDNSRRRWACTHTLIVA